LRDVRVARLVVVVTVVALAGLAATASARADFAVIPAGAAQPGSDPAHATPLETLLSKLATTIAGRDDVAVRCYSLSGWQNAIAGFDAPGEIGGFVYTPATGLDGTFAADALVAHLSPYVCDALEEFASAVAKPTKCPTVHPVAKTVTRLVTVKKRVKGKLVARKVKRTRTITVQELGTPAPCEPDVGTSLGTANERYTYALLAFAHESTHLRQDTIGSAPLSEADAEGQANCTGLQWVPWVAQQLGDTADDGQTLATWYFNRFFGTQYFPAEYVPSDCHADGPLDLTPGDGVWP
jgi:hypothetical protein